MTSRQRLAHQVRSHRWELTTVGTSGILIVIGIARVAGLS